MSWRTVLLLALLVGPAQGQPGYLAPPVDGPIVVPPPLDLREPGYTLPPRPLPLDGCDPGVEGWSIFGCGSAPVAWLVNWDLTVLKPIVDNELRVNPGIPANYSYQGLASAPLEWTVAPRLELGFRMPDGAGSFLIGYRGMFTEGTETLDAAAVRSRFNLQVIDLLYETQRIRLYGPWFVHSRIGGRILGTFYDTQNSQGALQQSASNNFWGGGLMGTFDLEREFRFLPGLSMFLNVDSGVVIGQVKQKFSTYSSASGSYLDSVEQKGSQAVQSFQVQFGLSYSPPTWQNLRFRVAYQYEHWFDLGQLDESSLDMFGHGAFVRMELAF